MANNYDIKLGVSLYSYQDNYYFHRFDLEGCLAAAAGAGAKGIEVFSDAMIPEWPYVSDGFVDKWNGWMERYGLDPVCLDHFSDRAMWHDKQLTDDEMYERGVLYIKTARKLGCSSIRVLHDAHIGVGISPYKLTTADIVERLLPVARDYDIMMALECHAPTNVADPVHEPYLEAAEKLGIPNVGLQVDFSSYEYCMSTADIILEESNGVSREILEMIRSKQREAYFAGEKFEFETIRADVEKMARSEADKIFLERKHFLFFGNCASFKDLEEYASKVVYTHGKFYDIDENGEVDNMDYHRIFKALKDGGYKGYICSEFEGNRRMNGVGWCDEIEYVRKHHVLMRKCLAE